jgi:hypothetical protein
MVTMRDAAGAVDASMGIGADTEFQSGGFWISGTSSQKNALSPPSDRIKDLHFQAVEHARHTKKTAAL